MLENQYYSFLLSQIIGLFMFILAVVMMGRMYFYRKLILQLQPDNPLITVCAIFELFLGTALVITHSVWEFKVLLWLTLISWIIFINAILWLALPEKMLMYTKRVCSGIGYYWFIVFLLIFGVLMLGRGVQLFVALHLSTFGR